MTADRLIPMTSRKTQVDVRKADPEAWSLALLYANGDTRRLHVKDDGSVIVRNVPTPRRPPTDQQVR